VLPHPIADKLVEADKARAAPALCSPTRKLHCDQGFSCPGRAANHQAIVHRGQFKDWLLLSAKKPLDVLFTLLDFLARAGSALLNWQTGPHDGVDLRGQERPQERMKVAFGLDAVTHPGFEVGAEGVSGGEGTEHSAVHEFARRDGQIRRQVKARVREDAAMDDGYVMKLRSQLAQATVECVAAVRRLFEWGAL
jgi:hypothetical protein